MKPENEGNSRIAPLDGWRTISVALVIFSHLTTNSSIAIVAHGEFGRAIIMPFLDECGSLGVSIFFVISGYVIAGGLIREHKINNTISIGNFYTRRALRIMPPLIMYVIAIMTLEQFDVIPRTTFSTVNALTFTCNLDIISCGGWFGGHTWSLSYEEQFYLVIPFLLYLLWRAASYLFVAMPFFIGLLTLVIFPLNEHMAGYFGHFVAIATGVAWASKEQVVLDVCRRANKIAAMAMPFLLIAAERLSNTRWWPVAVVTEPFVIAFIICYSSLISNKTAGVLSYARLTYFGRISYSIYLWQQLATYAFHGAGVLFYVISIWLCVLLSSASYKWIESPLISIGHSISRRRSQRLKTA